VRTLSAFAFTPTPSNAADVTAIKAKTDNLPAVPAAKGDVPTAADVATAVWAAGARTLTSFGTLASDAATAVWSAAVRSLTDKAGFTLHGSYDAAKSAASQASVNALPSADDVTQAVWDESLDTHNVAGSTGAALTAAGIAGDPWTADVPGNYDVGTAGALLPALAAALSALGAGSVVVTSPVAESGTVTLHAGDDYDPADGRGLLFTVADETHALHLDEAGCVVRFKSPQVTWSAASVSTTPAGYLVMFSLTHEQTSALSITRQLYELEATQADGDIITLATGTLVVVRDIPAVG